MTTTVYRIPRADPSHGSLICHLRSTTPEQAIAKLQSNGILAIKGDEENSIVLVGYRYEASALLQRIRMFNTLSPQGRLRVLKSLERISRTA